MTRLVLYAGTHETDWRQIQAQLVSWRADLDLAGVALHPADADETWQADLRSLATGSAPPAVEESVDGAVTRGAEIVLLGAEQLEDAIRSPRTLDGFASFAAAHGAPLTVLLVVRDQLGYLNALYCDRVQRLAMARGFAEFVADPSPAERFDYPSAYQALLDRPDIDVVAVPYSSLRPGRQAAALLAACGVDDDPLRDLPDVGGRPDRTGPVLVAASRLLFKRLWRLGLFATIPRARLGAAAARLRDVAEQGRWDATRFWGFDDETRAATIARFAARNDAFAQRVWGRDWTDWELGGDQEVDLAALDPALLVEVMRAVDQLVQRLQAGKRRPAAE